MAEKTEWIKAHCSRMDHGDCGICVGVRSGRIAEIKGDTDGFLNQGYICTKGRNAHEKLYHASRLKGPLRRIGDKGRPAAIGWGNAIEQHITAWDTPCALISLMAVCGTLDVPGGKFHAPEPSLLGLAQFVQADLVPGKVKEMIHAHRAATASMAVSAPV